MRSDNPDYDEWCSRCVFDTHYCHGCGAPTRHDGKLADGTKHPDCT